MLRKLKRATNIVEAITDFENVDDCSWRPVVSEPGGESVLVERESRVGIVHLDKLVLPSYIEITSYDVTLD